MSIIWFCYGTSIIQLNPINEGGYAVTVIDSQECYSVCGLSAIDHVSLCSGIPHSDAFRQSYTLLVSGTSRCMNIHVLIQQ